MRAWATMLAPTRDWVYDVSSNDVSIRRGGAVIIRLLPHGFHFQPSEDPAVHVVTFAEAGFSMLDLYLRGAGCTVEDVARFAHEVNERDEPGCLAPRLKLSAVPRRLIREATGTCEDELALATQVNQVLRANRESDLLHSRRLIFDFSTPDVARWVLNAVARAVFAHDDGLIEECMIVSPRRDPEG